MRFFRWILSNIIAIIIVVASIYSYVYWGNLVGSDTPAGKAIVYLSDEFVEVKEFVDGIKEKNKDKQQRDTPSVGHQESLASSESGDKKPRSHASAIEVENTAADSTVESGNNERSDSAVVSTAPEDIADASASITAPGNEASNTLVSAKASTDAINSHEKNTDEINTDEINTEVAIVESHNAEKWRSEQQPVTIHYSRNQTHIQQDSNGGLHELEGNSNATQNVAVPEIVQVETQQDGFVTPAIEKELETATADGGVAALTPDATRTLWIEARKAFYQRDYEKSEQRYKRVISMTKDNYDAYGELGNVYFHQGKNSEAADAYLAASVILIEQGHADRAKSLLGLMRYLDKDKAQLLQKRLVQ